MHPVPITRPFTHQVHLVHVTLVCKSLIDARLVDIQHKRATNKIYPPTQPYMPHTTHQVHLLHVTLARNGLEDARLAELQHQQALMLVHKGDRHLHGVHRERAGAR